MLSLIVAVVGRRPEVPSLVALSGRPARHLLQMWLQNVVTDVVTECGYRWLSPGNSPSFQHGTFLNSHAASDLRIPCTHSLCFCCAICREVPAVVWTTRRDTMENVISL